MMELSVSKNLCNMCKISIALELLTVSTKVWKLRRAQQKQGYTGPLEIASLKFSNLFCSDIDIFDIFVGTETGSFEISAFRFLRNLCWSEILRLSALSAFKSVRFKKSEHIFFPHMNQ
jgi:hypothetical protein